MGKSVTMDRVYEISSEENIRHAHIYGDNSSKERTAEKTKKQSEVNRPALAKPQENRKSK